MEPLLENKTPPLVLPGRLVRGLGQECAAGYPHEVCGLLIGTDGPRGTAAMRIVRARNLAVDRLADRYRLDPADFVAADAAARRDGLDVVGIWHSHPDHPARPSVTDREAAWEGYSYVIVSVAGGKPAEFRSWRLERGVFVEQPVQEVPS